MVGMQKTGTIGFALKYKEHTLLLFSALCDTPYVKMTIEHVTNGYLGS